MPKCPKKIKLKIKRRLPVPTKLSPPKSFKIPYKSRNLDETPVAHESSDCEEACSISSEDAANVGDCEEHQP